MPPIKRIRNAVPIVRIAVFGPPEKPTIELERSALLDDWIAKSKAGNRAAEINVSECGNFAQEALDCYITGARPNGFKLRVV
jgi:hypothetical protein